MEKDTLTKIFDVCRYSLECMLEETAVEGREVTGVVINSNYITLYTNNTLKQKDKILDIVEGTNIIPINLLDNYVSNYPRINLKKVNKEMLGSPNAEDEWNYILASIERVTVEEIVNPSDVLGTNIQIEKQRIYLKEGRASALDARRDLDKIARYQSASMFDYAVFELQTHGFKDGMYRMDDMSVYGFDKENNEYVKLGTLPAEVTREEYLKRLAFRTLSFNSRKREDGADTHFVSCPSIKSIKINDDLREALDQKTGIIILDSLMAVDLINSDFADDKGIKSIWYSGNALAKKNQRLYVTSLGTSENKRETILKRLFNMNYNIILDDNGYLTTEDIISLSQVSLVVLGEKISDVRVFCNTLSMDGTDMYNKFIDNIIYMGSIYTNTGMVISDTSRHLLKTRDLYSFGEVLDDNKVVSSVLRTLVQPDITQVAVRSGSAIITTRSGKEKRVQLNKPITDKHIINFLWKVTNQGEHKTMIDLLNEEGNFTTIYTQRDKEDREDMLIKLNVFKTGTGLNLRAYNIESPSIEVLEEDAPGTIKVYKGSRGTGKTHQLKKAAYGNSRGKRILLIDRDFDFDAREFKTAKEVTVVRDKGTITTTLIKNFNPEVIIINTPVTGQELFEYVENTEKKAKVYIASTYDIIEEMKDYYKNSPPKLKICEMLESRVTITEQGER